MGMEFHPTIYQVSWPELYEVVKMKRQAHENKYKAIHHICGDRRCYDIDHLEVVDIRKRASS